MLTQLQAYYRPSNQVRLLPQWNQFVESLVPQQEQIKRRFFNLSNTQPTTGYQILLFILKEADIPLLASRTDDFYNYTTQLSGILAGTKNLFDLARSGKTYRRLFVYPNSKPTLEYLVPVDDNDWLKFLPLGKDYPAWTHIQPLKLWWYDTDEYTLDLLTGLLRFRENPPNMVLWLLDIPALVMKATNWYRYQLSIGETRPDLGAFIHTEVLSFILDDVISTWYFKLHQLTVDILLGIKPETAIDEMAIRSQSQWGSIGARFKPVMEALLQYYGRVATGELHPRGVISQKFYGKSEISLRDILASIDIMYDIPHAAPFNYLRLIRDLPFLEYIIKLYQLETLKNPGSVEFRNLMERLYTLLVKWKNNVPPSTIKNAFHRTLVDNKIDDLFSLAQCNRHASL